MTMNLAHHSSRATDASGREGDKLSIELLEIKNKVDSLNLSRPDDNYLRNGLSIGFIYRIDFYKYLLEF